LEKELAATNEKLVATNEELVATSAELVTTSEKLAREVARGEAVAVAQSEVNLISKQLSIINLSSIKLLHVYFDMTKKNRSMP